MVTSYGHLTYCTNIHGGESWADHFDLLRTHFPVIKKAVCPKGPMGIGLRLADLASKVLADDGQLAEFRDWLSQEDAYVFTMNGFPFGAFHNRVVKAHVHAPDWTTDERLQYTNRLFDILSVLIPDGMEGGISTSPLAYRHWYNDTGHTWRAMREHATRQVVEVAAHLLRIRLEVGKTLHLDIEPEPDGVLESGPEFITWYNEELIPMGVATLSDGFGIGRDEAEQALKRHIRLCYDVCHFALGYEHHRGVIDELDMHGIQIGKFQISAAIRAAMPADTAMRQAIGDAFMAFDEPTYLHQVIAQQRDGRLVRFRDLQDAYPALFDEETVEWRSHFHVPIFSSELGRLTSTQSDILDVLAIQREKRRTAHLEVETYTWGVLPGHLQLPVAKSISRELMWVLDQLP